MRFDEANRCTCRRSSDLHKSSNGSCRFCFGLNNIEEKIFAEYGDIGVDIYRYLMQFNTPAHQNCYPGWALPNASRIALAPMPDKQRLWTKYENARQSYVNTNAFHAMIVTRRKMMREADQNPETLRIKSAGERAEELLAKWGGTNCECTCIRKGREGPCQWCQDMDEVECDMDPGKVFDRWEDQVEAWTKLKSFAQHGARKHPMISKPRPSPAHVKLDLTSTPDVTAYWHSAEGPISKERYEQLLPQAIGPLPGAAAAERLYVCKDMAPESGAPGMMFGESVWCATASPTVRWGVR